MELQYELKDIQRGMDEKLYHISMQHKEEKQRLSEQYRQKNKKLLNKVNMTSNVFLKKWLKYPEKKVLVYLN